MNKFQKIVVGEKFTAKDIFDIEKMLDIEHGNEGCSVRINTGAILFDFFCETIEERNRLKNCLENAKANAK